MNTNSLQAYAGLDLTQAQGRVYKAVSELGEASMNRVSEYLGVPKNTISGRFGELVKDGVLEVVRKTIENGSTVGVYAVKKQGSVNWDDMRQDVINSWRKPQTFTSSEGLF